MTYQTPVPEPLLGAPAVHLLCHLVERERPVRPPRFTNETLRRVRALRALLGSRGRVNGWTHFQHPDGSVQSVREDKETK